MAKESGYKSISRIDQPHKKHHGWYVRVTWLQDTYSKFFSDKQHGGKSSALKEAVDYRNQVEAELGKPRSEGLVLGRVRRSNTGERGIRRLKSTQVKGGRTYTWDVFQVTYHPAPGKTRRTSVSIQKYGEEAAFQRAIAIRKAADEERLKRMALPRRDVDATYGVTKRYLKRSKCRVTFRFPVDMAPIATSVHVVGDFNEWSSTAHPLMKRKTAGVYTTSLTIKTGRDYEYRYLINGLEWVSDPFADRTVANPYGGQNSVLDLTIEE